MNSFFIAGAPLGNGALDLRLSPLPRTDNEGYEWVDPAPRPGGEHNCGNCHAEIYREWARSGHSRSASGRRFRGLYEGTDWEGEPGVSWGLLNEHPLGAGVCASCHAPALSDRDPALFDLREVDGTAARGVHCDYCHKIADIGDGTLGLTHGRFNLRLLRPARGQIFFGPLDDVDRGEDAYSPLYRKSRYCASCHEGTVFGVHVYATYTEWLRSPARRQGKQCQDCHMNPTGHMTNIAPGHGGIERDPRTLASHTFFPGGQAAMLRRSVQVTAQLTREGSVVRAEVQVGADGAGHRVPTGYIDRHLLLVVEAQTADGKPVAARQGPVLPGPAGKRAGQSGRLYGRLLTDEQGHSPAPFWRFATEGPDTRLTSGQTDVSVYVFPRTLARLRVRLLYRRFWEEVTAAKGWPDRDLTVFDQTFSGLPGSTNAIASP